MGGFCNISDRNCCMDACRRRALILSRLAEHGCLRPRASFAKATHVARQRLADLRPRASFARTTRVAMQKLQNRKQFLASRGAYKQRVSGLLPLLLSRTNSSAMPLESIAERKQRTTLYSRRLTTILSSRSPSLASLSSMSSDDDD